MNFRKLLTYLTVGTAAVIPFAGAQNPTILQGSYISNVFGNSNFVKNPNAQTNVANVTNATRSTTTPLVATSEFNLSLDAGQNATWTLRTFDAGMKGQNCEARFSYRGFATATTTAEIVQNSLVVAQLVLTPSTDPRIASINFPCGDLANATTFRIAQTTANMTGTNEIGGVYTGLATNMANVAQAEEVGSIYIAPVANCNWERTGAGSNTFGNFSADADCTTPVATGAADTTAGKIPGAKFNNLKPGKYLFMVSYPVFKSGAANDYVATRMTDSTNYSASYMNYVGSTIDAWIPVTAIMQVEYTTTTSPTIQIQGKTETTTNTIRVYNDGINTGGFRLTAYRFPTSSELVVTPERQNWYVSASHTGANPDLGLVDITTKTEITDAALTLTPDTASQPVATLCSATNAPPSLSTSATTCAAGNESLGITFNIPSPGAYEVCAQFSSNTVGNAASGIDMGFSIEETATNANTALTSNKANVRFSRAGSSDLNTAMPFQQCNNILFSSIGQKAVRLMYQQSVTPTMLVNIILADNARARAVAWTVRPLANQSNSALYVQGPVLSGQTGSVLPVGYIGEEIVSTSASSGSIANGVVTATRMSLTLTPGTWLVQGNIAFDPSPNSFTFNRLSISLNNNSVDPNNAIQPQAALAGSYESYSNLTKILRVTTSTTIYLVTATSVPIGTAAYAQGSFSAIRIGSN